MIVNIYHASTLFTVVLYNFRLCIIRTNQSQLYNVLFPLYAAPKLTKMTVTVMFISLVALTAISVSNVLADHIDLEFNVDSALKLPILRQPLVDLQSIWLLQTEQLYSMSTIARTGVAIPVQANHGRTS